MVQTLEFGPVKQSIIAAHVVSERYNDDIDLRVRKIIKSCIPSTNELKEETFYYSHIQH